MRYVVIPNTDLRVSQICIGSTDAGAGISAADTFALFDEFAAQGGTFIDTAHIYSDWIPGTHSTSEKTIGQWMRARGNRAQMVIGTKGAHPEMATMHVSRLSRDDIALDLTESLDYLQTDYIDIYWLHRDDVNVPVGEIVDTLSEQVDSGMIRCWGVSNWTTTRIQAANDYAAQHGKHPIVANQPLWSLAQPNMELHPDQTLADMNQEALDFHRRTGMAAVAYSSQAHGFYTKRDRSGWDELSKGDRTLFENARNQTRLERTRELARRHAVQINEIALAYLLCQPFTTIPIIGSKRIDQLHSSLKALDVSLSQAEVVYLEA